MPQHGSTGRLAAALLLLLLALSSAASAAEEGLTAFTLVAHGGNAYYWTLANATERNPTIVVAANAVVNITILADDPGEAHNLVVDGHGSTVMLTGDVKQASLAITTPASGFLEYWCQPHRSLGMAGTLRVAGTPERNAPSLGSAAAAAAIALGAMLARRR